MPGNLKGFILSVCLIGVLEFFSSLFKDKVTGRKFLHIGVANWFFIYQYYFSVWYWPVLGLVLSAVMNLIIQLKSSSDNWGTVVYPLMICLCIACSELGFGSVACTGCAVLGMGYGDGFATLVGRKFGKRKMPHSAKTVLGSLCVFIIVATVVGVMGIGNSVLYALLVGLAATLTECYSKGFWDNITLPAVIYILTALMV